MTEKTSSPSVTSVFPEQSGTNLLPHLLDTLQMKGLILAVAALVLAALLSFYLLRNRRRKAMFDAKLDRSNTFSVKDQFVPSGTPSHALKLWVADMDLPICQKIQVEIIRRAKHPIFGYTFQPPQVFAKAAEWIETNHRWSPDPAQFVFSPCVVTSFANILRSLTQPSDRIMLMTPLYKPMQEAVVGTGRQLVSYGLTMCPQSGRFHMDFERLLPLLCNIRMLFLCSPHNPGGCVWTSDELECLINACARHKILLVADEIWADWTLFGNRHIPVGLAGKNIHCDVITMGAPTKTWNLAGMHCSYIIFNNEELKLRYLSYAQPAFMTYGSTFSTTVMLAAYTHGAQWLLEAKEYIEGNITFLLDALQRRVPGIKAHRPQATYLVLLDCQQLGLTSEQLESFILQDAGLLLSFGSQFAEDFGQFCRINCATSRSVLRQAVDRLERAVGLLMREASTA